MTTAACAQSIPGDLMVVCECGAYRPQRSRHGQVDELLPVPDALRGLEVSRAFDVIERRKAIGEFCKRQGVLPVYGQDPTKEDYGRLTHVLREGR